MINGDPMANLVMPFDTEVPIYLDHNGTVLDYSGLGNDGINVRAQWVPDGVVGGAYNFSSGSLISVPGSQQQSKRNRHYDCSFRLNAG